jgi:hypothetical protein
MMKKKTTTNQIKQEKEDLWMGGKQEVQTLSTMS